jgi:hypothetical protein
LLAVKLDCDDIAAAGVTNLVKQRPLTRVALERQMKLVVGDLATAKVEQRLGVGPRERSEVFHQLPYRPKQGQDKVTLISLESHKLVLAGVAGEITFHDLTTDTKRREG